MRKNGGRRVGGKEVDKGQVRNGQSPGEKCGALN